MQYAFVGHRRKSDRDRAAAVLATGPGGGVAPAPSSYILRGPSRKACEGAVDLDERLRRSLFLKDYGATGLSMVGVAQLVEPRVVIPVVVGSSPIVHPIFLMGR
jgi:hypothetical protein